MDGGVVRLILAAIAAVMILCVSVSGTDLTIVLLGGIALVLIRRTWRAPLGPPKKTNHHEESRGEPSASAVGRKSPLVPPHQLNQTKPPERADRD